MGQVIKLPMQPPQLKQIIEAALLAAVRPLSVDRLLELFAEEEAPERKRVREILEELQQEYAGRGIELREVGTGFRIQVRAEFAPWVSRLWEERPGRYSRALMETLALIAYRQPVTRAEIEEIRGVSVSTNIIKTLVEREWVHVVGHRDVPGKPALYATTREFLDYFSLKGLSELPTLAELRDLDSINRELDLREVGEAGPDAAVGPVRFGDGAPQTVDDAARPEGEPVQTRGESASARSDVMQPEGVAPGPAIEAEQTLDEVVEPEAEAAQPKEEAAEYEESIAGPEGEAEPSPQTATAVDPALVFADSPGDQDLEPAEADHDKQRSDSDD